MIKIIDNFFEKEMHNKIVHHVKTKLYFTPMYYDFTEAKKENYYGDRFKLHLDKNLQQTFVQQAEKKFKIKIKRLSENSGVDLRNLDRFEPHIDKGFNINILIMLDGPIGVTTGTVFYTDNELDMHVGFRPNRAILFPSNKVHSQHKSDVKNMKRYTTSLFIHEYEDVL